MDDNPTTRISPPENNPEAMPEELKALPQWVLWKMHSIGGREATKVPFQANGEKAKAGEPSTWTTFDIAMESYQRGGYLGVGFEFHDDEYCGIDLDSCRNPASGVISEWAQHWIDRFDSYTEISPSLTGVKIFVRGRNPLPSGKNLKVDETPCSDKSPGVEIYDQKRYFAVTGHKLEHCPATCEPRQAIIDEFCRRYWPKAFEQPEQRQRSNGDQRCDIEERAARYVAKIPGAVSGSGGHDATFHVACVLVVEFGLTPEDAFPILAEWNAKCEPPWPDPELQHKLDDADKQPGERGKLRHKNAKLTRNSKRNLDPSPALSATKHILIEPAVQPVGDVVKAITDCLLGSNEVFNRADQAVLIRGENIVPILKACQLSGVVNEFAEVVVCPGDKEPTFRPLPAEYGNVWLNRISEFAKLPIVRLYTKNPVYTADYQLAKPGFNADSGIYFAGTAITPTDGTSHLDTLLRDFCFKTPGDRTNYIGMLLTTLLVSKFIGSKPAVVFNGNQPELGKSILAQIIAIVRDGQHVETATYNANDEEFEKRLGSIVRRGSTTIIVDNAKARGRTVTIESATLERSITDPILSFRLLGGSSDIRTENSHIFCITANTPEISRDLITRSVLVNLHHEGNPTARRFSVVDPEGYTLQYRSEILAELCGMVERWKAAGMPLAVTESRFNKRGWGNIIGGILEANGEPDFLANATEAAEQMDSARREFGELVEAMANHPQGSWTCAELVGLADKHGLLRAELGDGSQRSKATKIGVLATRYVGVRFEVEGSALATFHKRSDRNGSLYSVGVADDE